MTRRFPARHPMSGLPLPAGRGEPADAPSARISGPAELAQAIPYLLGFHPRRSLVLVGLQADGGHRVTARYDLDDLVPDAFSPLTVDGARSLAAIADRLAGAGVDAVVAVIYDDTAIVGGGLSRDADGRLPYDLLAVSLPDVVAAAAAGGAPGGILLLDALLVAGRRWWSFECAEDACCPAEGTPIPDVPSEFATDAVVRGIVPLADRESLARLLEPHDDRQGLLGLVVEAENAAAAVALDGGGTRHRRSLVRALFAAARQSHAPNWTPPDAGSTARFAANLGSLEVRDAVWMGIESRRIDGRPLWRHLARSVPEPYDATPLFLYGWACWRDGDGASANIAAERALVSDPACSAADLLLAAVSTGVDPRTFPRLRKPA